jgi:hypothetical protein
VGNDWQAILSIYSTERENFSSVNWATCSSKLGKMSPRDKAQMTRSELYGAFIRNLSLSMTASPELRHFGGRREVVNITHSLAKFSNFRTDRQTSKAVANILDAVEINSDWLLEENSPHHVSNLAWAFAKFNRRATALFKKFDELAYDLVENGRPQAISITAWAFATLGIPAPALFEKIEEDAGKSIVENGSAQAISNTAWAFAALNFPAPALFGQIDARSSYLVENGTPQAIANTAWACATLGLAAPALFEKINEDPLCVVVEGSSQAIANTAWAFASLGVAAPALFEKIDEHPSWLVPGKPQHISITAWAFATLSVPAPNLFEKIEEDAGKSLVSDGSAQGFSNTAWAFASLSYDAPDLFKTIDERSDHLLRSGDAQGIANTAMAFAELGIRPELFFVRFEERMEEFLRAASFQAVFNVCWALVILDLTDQHGRLLQSLWARAMYVDDVEALGKDAVLQLVQVEMHAKASGIVLREKVGEGLRRRMVEACEMLELGDQHPNDDELSRLLRELGFEHEREVSPVDEEVGMMLSIDMACRERMVAVEYDGSYHYLSSGRENGRTVAKRRLLERLGWKVVNIPWYDNVEMSLPGFVAKNRERGSSRELKKAYLKGKLEAAGVVTSEERRADKLE